MNNDTTVNVNIGATDSSADVVKNAASNFSNLWEQVAAGEVAAQLAQKAFDVVVGSIGTAISTAGNFQAQLVQLVTGAGESQSNLALVGNGIKQIAISTGTTLDQLTSGMYLIESAGFHGAAGLNILKVAAEGAKADGADLATVANALTTVLHDYNIPASQAAQVTNQMVTAVAQGKMHMQDFASSLSTVLPLANQVGISFAQVAGAEATLTAGGVSADQATQDLSAIIKGIQSPTLQQINIMQQMGLSSLNLSQNLGSRGLTGTLQIMSNAITSHMKDGLVFQSAMQNSTVATQDLKVMLASMPASLQGISRELENGSISYADYRKATQALPEGLTNLAKQFETTYNKANSFNKLLTSGSPDAQTYAQAIKTMTGQSDAMSGVLMLTGTNAKTFQDNVNKVSDAAKKAGSNIADWALIQSTFNQKLAEMHERMQVGLEDLGEKLLPILSLLMDHYQSIIEVIKDVGSIVGGILLVVGAMKAWELATLAAGKAQIALKAIMATDPIELAAMAIIAVALLIITHWSLVKQWFSDFVDWFKSIWSEVSAKTEAVWDAVKDGANKVIQWLKSNWELVVVTILTGPIGLAVVEIIRHRDAIINAFSNMWERLKSDAAQWGSDMVNAIESGLKALLMWDLSQILDWYQALDKWWQEIDAWFRALPKRLQSDLDNWWTSIRTWADSIPGKLSKEFDTWWQATDTWFRSIPGKIEADLDKWWDAIQTWVKSIPHRIVEQLDRWKSEIEQWFKNLPKSIESSLSQSGKEMADKHTMSFEQFWKDSKRIAEIAGVILLALVAIPVIIAVALAAQMVIFGIKIIGWILNGITTAVITVVRWFMSLGPMIVNAIGNAGSLLYNVGRDIVQGLINGVQSMIGAVSKTVGNVASGAVSMVKNLLGIHSPSTVFAEIGQNMGQGLIQGLQGMQIQANLATTQLVTGSSVVNSANSSGVTPTASSNVSNTYSSGGNTHSIYIQNLVLPNVTDKNSFYQSLNQDTLNTGMGLTPVQGTY